MGHSSKPRTTRLSASLIALAGAMFALFPILRPWGDKVGGEAGVIDAMSSPAWVVAHLVGSSAFVFLSLGMLGVRDLHRTVRDARLSDASLVSLWGGTAGVLLYYGVETFGLHAVAKNPSSTTVEAITAMREGLPQLTAFGLGLLLIAMSAVMFAASVWRSRLITRWSAIPLAVMLATYLPQFFTPPMLRITHGELTAVAALILAVAVLRGSKRTANPSQGS